MPQAPDPRTRPRFDDVLASRRSCRAYLPDPIAPEVLDRVLGAANRGPSAGNTWAIDLVVLEGPEQVASYWDTTLTPDRRARFPWPGLLAAPVLVVPVVDPEAYVARYAEPDKAATGLGSGFSVWPVPYWYIDGGAAVMAMLLAATAEGLGSLLFGQFGRTEAVKRALSIPAARMPLGTVALGYPDPDADRPSSSASRGRPGLGSYVHRGRWGARF